MTSREIVKEIRGMLETNTRVNWGHADYTPEEEFQSMLDEIDKMIADQKSVEYNKGWNDALGKAQEIVGAHKND
jgi:hypothetical protein|tara:strand:- start:620 stop:841 length:222 start_codon:yes stop_codon:yes gene_type:complete